MRGPVAGACSGVLRPHVPGPSAERHDHISQRVHLPWHCCDCLQMALPPLVFDDRSLKEMKALKQG